MPTVITAGGSDVKLPKYAVAPRAIAADDTSPEATTISPTINASVYELKPFLT
jgi:hypothetical protein